MCHRRNQKPTCAARAIQNALADFWIDHVYSHFHDIAWREKFSSIAPKVSTDNLFIGFAFDVDIGVKQTVTLQLADDVGEASRLELDLIVGIKNLALTFLNAFKNLGDAFLNR